ncbi:MAG: glucan biosynthesis protein G [Gammaproteobacteria bacterium]|nr:glucan biosynthesis protein G [Gammaproteobacteria bacterium]
MLPDSSKVAAPFLVVMLLLPLLTQQAWSSPSAEPAFSHDSVLAEARALAASPYAAPQQVPAALKALNYDVYRSIRFRKERAVRLQEDDRFSVELFAPGFLFETGVELFVVRAGRSEPLLPDEQSFETPSPEISRAIAAFARSAGFRLHYPINETISDGGYGDGDYADEFIVFQGASYLRAVSRRQIYGLSARGLALDVAQRGGEEFPMFRRFWIEAMAGEPSGIVVHALLDSPSVAGAYRFEIWPGLVTTLDVAVTLFPRRALTHVGLAPLTSMYMHGPMDGPDAPDYRPAVHDSDGISMFTGAGEWIYRPLVNPRSLQVSAFLDSAPQGFGLVQRSRRFDQFEDLEARYEQRPSAWIEPRGDWGAGHLELVEIPSASEANDNMVAYWRPRAELPAHQPYSFAYRLSWPDRVPMRDQVPQVQRSAMGRTLGTRLPQAVIDWDTRLVPADAELSAVASASAGRVLETLLQRNEETGGTRVFVTFEPGRAPVVELRVELQIERRIMTDLNDGEDEGGDPGPDQGLWESEKRLGEVWLYRWLAE